MPARIGMTLAMLGALTLCGCGSTPTAAVKAKMQQFATASEEHDYTTICTQVLAPALTAHLTATGVSCEQAWQLVLGKIAKPYLSIGQVSVKGSNATVMVLSVAQGQRSSLDAVGLIKTGAGWRIESLDEPLTGSSG